MESGLTFNQLICEFESRHPRQQISDLSYVGRSSNAQSTAL